MAIDSLSGISSEMYNSSVRSSSSTGLSVDDFLILLAAQMSNQDMMNPMSDTDFMGQLAQFTTLQAIQQQTELSSVSYSVGLMGKEVTVARVLSTGELMTKTGVVTGVGLYNGEPVIFIDDEPYAYSLGEIMVVGAMPLEEAEENKDDGTGGIDEDGGAVEQPGDESGSGGVEGADGPDDAETQPGDSEGG